MPQRRAAAGAVIGRIATPDDAYHLTDRGARQKLAADISIAARSQSRGRRVYLELDGQGPHYGQLVRALKAAILDGRLAAGARLPATRALADDLGVSRNTVLAAYEQLGAEGYLDGRVGSGSYVAALETRRPPHRSEQSVPAQSRYIERARRVHTRGAARIHRGLRYNLQYGDPMTNPALSSAWGRELARAVAYTGLESPSSQGLPALREAVCDYLARRRGVRAQADDVLIINGTQQAFALCTRVLLDEGDPVVIEQPHYFGAKQALEAHGARLLPVRTDRDGLVCAELPQEAPKLIYVTPSHQFPGGSVLSLPRRLELLRYAGGKGCWILEDDYDSEFRYDAKPLAALRELDGGERVIYVGTFSKALFGALRLGYMVLPAALREDFITAKYLADFGSPAIEQAALANFIVEGSFERHLRRATKMLKERRAAMLEGLRKDAGDRIEIDDGHAGMHLVVWLRGYTAERLDALIALARRYELGLYPIARHYLQPPTRQGLLLGYAGLSPAELETAMRLFGRCLDEMA